VRNISCSATEKIFIFCIAAALRLRARQILSTEAHFPSTLALDGCWHRLERNLAADVAAAWSGATLTGVRGMAFHAYHASSAMWVDDVRFSNAMTLERNSLLPGAVGQIACRRATDATNFGHTDAFYFYDHIGNVQGVSSSGGAVAETYVQDAWGNVLASATTGQWATSFAGRHLTTKEQDADVGMYYFWQRWQRSQTGFFLSRAPLPPDQEHPYNIVTGNPLRYHDSSGMQPQGSCENATPASAGSGICNIYKCDETFMQWNAKCVCEGAGESPWDQFVRGCLACLRNRGIRPDIAHGVCYSWADARYGTLAGRLAWLDIAARLANSCMLSQNPSNSPFTKPLPPWAVAP